MPALVTRSPERLPKSHDSGVGIELTFKSGSECSSETDRLNNKAGDIVIGFEEPESEDTCEEEIPSSSFMKICCSVCGAQLKWVVLGIFALLYAAYFICALAIYAMSKCDERHNVRPLIYLTIAIVGGVVYWFITSRFRDEIDAAIITPLKTFVNNHWDVLKWLMSILPFVGVLVIIVASAVQRPSNMMSLLGWLFLVLFLYFCSRAPGKINWRPVLGGFTLQFYFATMILKWDKGYQVVSAIGQGFVEFLNFTNYGSTFVFGNTDDHFLVFKVFPVIIFFSSVTSMMYYLGVMQVIISNLAAVMRVTLDTTAAESLCAAGNIFVGQIEAPTMIRPFLPIMTRSELHSVMTGGFATMAGSIFAAYVMKGVPAIHLLTASVMNAPTALAVSKLLYPELGQTKSERTKEIIKEKQPFNNVIEAGAAGASGAIAVVANVVANLISAVALLYFFNSLIAWFGAFVCLPGLSFQVICSYLFMPLAYLMGVEWKDAGVVAELIGIKTFLTEFIAYDHLSGYMANRIKCQAGTVISARSETIATFALCGFANVMSLGIQIAGVGSMAPHRLGEFAQLGVTALLGGICTTLLTACVAGFLILDTQPDVTCLSMNTTTDIVNSTRFNSSTALLNTGIVL